MQLKTGVYALTAKSNDLVSNWEHMVMASLAWRLKAWRALLARATGVDEDRHEEEKRKLLRMELETNTEEFIEMK